MKILLISSYLPYPLTNGGHIRLYNLLKELQISHEITLICEIRPTQSREDVREVEKFCKNVITVPRKKQWSIKNIIKAGLSDNSFLITGHTNKFMKQLIQKELLKNEYNLIHVETFYVLQNVPATAIPIVLVEHNIEYKVYERFGQKAPLLIKPILNLDINKIIKDEKRAWRRASVVVTVSNDDLKEINLPNTAVVPNGVDINSFVMKDLKKEFSKGKKKILYIGDYSWIQNTDAVHFIVNEIWPIIANKNKNVSLWIVGRNMPTSFLEYGNENIYIDIGNKMTTSQIFTEASVLLAPKRVGGGTSYKTLEAFAVGTPVVTTPLGLEGLEVESDIEIAVSETPEGLADSVIKLLEDEEYYKKLAVNGRKHVEKKFDWKIVSQKLEDVYSQVGKNENQK